MSCFKKVLLLLAIIGGINWGSIGIFGFDLVGFLFGGQGLLLDGLHLLQQACSLFRQGSQLLPEFGNPHILFLKDQQLV